MLPVAPSRMVMVMVVRAVRGRLVARLLAAPALLATHARRSLRRLLGSRRIFLGRLVSAAGMVMAMMMVVVVGAVPFARATVPLARLSLALSFGAVAAVAAMAVVAMLVAAVAMVAMLVVAAVAADAHWAHS